MNEPQYISMINENRLRGIITKCKKKVRRGDSKMATLDSLDLGRRYIYICNVKIRRIGKHDSETN